jgi:monoamine oxidase
MDDTTRRVSRRSLIAGAAAGAAAGALPVASARAAAGTRRTEVAIVGAGLAGLTAAHQLTRRGKSVLVVEARDRVGGRTLNHSIGGGHVIEVGGQWIGPTQDRLAALAKQMGVKTFKTYNQGDTIIWLDGKAYRSPAAAPVPTLPADGTQSLLQLVAALDGLAKNVPLEAPWRAPNARELDGQTFETWKLANVPTQLGRDITDLITEAVWAAEPSDVSLLHVLFYIASAGDTKNPGSLARLISTGGGAQESRFVGGSQRVSLELAKRLGARRLMLGAPVRRIAHSGKGVRLVTDRGSVVAKHVIVAVPPTLAGRIDYEPGLPALRDQLTQRIPQGSSIKCQAIYSEPFWRKDGLSGQVNSNEGPVKLTFDNTPPGGSPGVILGFLEGHNARVLGAASASARRKAVIDNFVRYFGPKAAKPRAYVEHNWAEEVWTRGCYVGYTPPGVLTEFGEALRRPVGRIHWAGSETATVWNGYMDGAVSSGERAAAEVLARL